MSCILPHVIVTPTADHFIAIAADLYGQELLDSRGGISSGIDRDGYCWFAVTCDDALYVARQHDRDAMLTHDVSFFDDVLDDIADAFTD